MASSHLVGIAPPLFVSDLTAAQQGSPEQGPLSPSRAVLSPGRSPSPGLQSVSLRPLPLSPTRLMPALALPPHAAASPLCGAATLEDPPAAAPLDPPLALDSTPGALLLSGPPNTVLEAPGNAVSLKALASAHILGAVVALLSNAPEAAANQGDSESLHDSAVQQPPEGETSEGALSSGGVSPAVPGEAGGRTEESEVSVAEQGTQAMPWWLAGDGAPTGSTAAGEREGVSWWAQQVEAARAEERAQEARALQESLHNNKGPDAPYALEGADPLLGAASPSLGDAAGGGAWWSQLTKIPTADWLHLPSQQGPPQPCADTIVVEREGHTEKVEAEIKGSPANKEAARIDGKEMDLLALGTIPLVPTDQEGTTHWGTPIEETATSIVTKGPIVGESDTLPLLQASDLAREHQFNIEADSPPKGADQAESLPLLEGAPILSKLASTDVLAEVSTSPRIDLASEGATLAPFQDEASQAALNGQAEHAAGAGAASGETARAKAHRAAVEEARARLETIKAWRSSRTPQVAPAVAPPAVLPVLSGLPSPTLGMGIFPTRGSSVVASVKRPDVSVWRTLQELEWATEETADTFGRTSVAVHLAERHDDKHA